MATFRIGAYSLFFVLLVFRYLTEVECGQNCLTCSRIRDIAECQLFTTCNDNEVREVNNFPRDCSEIDNVTSGVRLIYPSGTTPSVQAYCDVNGSDVWTVIQRRINGCTDFYRNWDAYKTGFGDVNGEYWLGNENIYQITSNGRYKLRVDLGDFDNHFARAEYAIFHVGDEASQYQLSVTGFSGTAGDAMTRHNGNKFSTFDRDNDNCTRSTIYLNCALVRKGAWWYECCYDSNLNGKYLGGVYAAGIRTVGTNNYTGINWDKWRGENYSLKSTRMMIRKY